MLKGDGDRTKGSKVREEDVVRAGVAVMASDFKVALEGVRSSHSDSIGAPKVCFWCFFGMGVLSSLSNLYRVVFSL